MRISSYCGGFTLYEVMISITSMGILSGLFTVSLLPLLDRSEFVNTADQFLRHSVTGKVARAYKTQVKPN